MGTLLHNAHRFISPPPPVCLTSIHMYNGHTSLCCQYYVRNLLNAVKGFNSAYLSTNHDDYYKIHLDEGVEGLILRVTVGNCFILRIMED